MRPKKLDWGMEGRFMKAQQRRTERLSKRNSGLVALHWWMNIISGPDLEVNVVDDGRKSRLLQNTGRNES